MFPGLVILYQCISNDMKVSMILQYYTRNRMCLSFPIHMYHIICHWSFYYQIKQIENHGVLELALIRNNMWRKMWSSVKWLNFNLISSDLHAVSRTYIRLLWPNFINIHVYPCRSAIWPLLMNGVLLIIDPTLTVLHHCELVNEIDNKYPVS